MSPASSVCRLPVVSRSDFRSPSILLMDYCRPHSQIAAYRCSQHGSSISVYLLTARLRRSWSPPPAISWPRSLGLPSCQTGYIPVRRTYIILLTPDNAHQTGTHFLPTSDTIFSLSTFNCHTKTFIFLLAHAARLGILFYEKHAIHCYHFRCVPNRTQRDWLREIATHWQARPSKPHIWTSVVSRHWSPVLETFAVEVR